MGFWIINLHIISPLLRIPPLQFLWPLQHLSIVLLGPKAHCFCFTSRPGGGRYYNPIPKRPCSGGGGAESSARGWGVIGPHAHGNTGRQVADDHDNTRRGWRNMASRTRKRGETCGGQPGRGGEWAAKTTPTSTTPSAPTTRPRCCGNDATRNTGRSGRQNAVTRRSTRGDCPGPREEPATRQNVTQGVGEPPPPPSPERPAYTLPLSP